jgi:tight adherence protein C
MTVAALIALAVLLGFGAAWELMGAAETGAARRGRRALVALSRGRVRSFSEAGPRLGIPNRLVRAGLEERLSPATVLAAKLGCAVAAVPVSLAAVPALGGRLGAVTFAVLVAAGFLAPDAVLERRARHRRERLVAALPDALDLLAVGAASGRSPASGLGEIASSTHGPLAGELALAVAEIECGASQGDAVDRLRRRVGGAEVGALAAALERSRRYGSPLAGQLHAQARALRRDAGRRIGERAARAAPKIQLVIALVLVPSVLLTILAAIIAHSDALLRGF